MPSKFWKFVSWGVAVAALLAFAVAWVTIPAPYSLSGKRVPPTPAKIAKISAAAAEVGTWVILDELLKDA